MKILMTNPAMNPSKDYFDEISRILFLPISFVNILTNMSLVNTKILGNINHIIPSYRLLMIHTDSNTITTVINTLQTSNFNYYLCIYVCKVKKNANTPSSHNMNVIN